MLTCGPRLTTRSNPVGHPALQHDRVQQRSRCVNSGRVPGGAAAHDAHLCRQLLKRRHDFVQRQGPLKGGRVS